MENRREFPRPAARSRRLLLLCLGLAATNAAASARLQVGLGDRYDQPIDGKRVVVYKQAEKDGLRFKYAALWLTPGWTGWVDKGLLRRIVRDGYTPLLIYYTFGDRSSKEYLEANDGAKLKAWHEDIEKNLAPLVDVGAEVLVALEPEFNVVPPSGTPLTAWEGWNDAAGKAIDALHAASPLVKVGLCPGDWGNYDLDTSMRAAAKKSDFIAFPEMRAATDPSVDASSARYRDVIGAALDFTAYLKKTFGKPILFSYLAVSSYAGADPLGWEDVQADIVGRIFDHEDELLRNGVFGLAYFSYYDDPTHGTEFFGEAERHFGLRDSRGKPKKAWAVWKARTGARPEPAGAKR